MKALLSALTAVALAAAALAGGWVLRGEHDEPAAVPAPTGPARVPAGWHQCVHGGSVAVAYPRGWYAAEDCTAFDPAAFSLTTPGDLTTALVLATVPPLSAAGLRNPDFRFWRVVSHAERAGGTRIERAATGEGLDARGTPSVVYLFDLASGETVALTATGKVGTAVVDRVARSLRLGVEPLPERLVGSPGAGTLPPHVEATRRAILRAAEARDYEALDALIREDEFRYSFGGPVEGGAIAYWRGLERTQGERPFETLAELLRMPYTLHAGHYVWPFAFDKQVDELTAYERELLRPVLSEERDYRAWREFGGYAFWRVGIHPDGSWRFFLAGD